MIWSGTRFKVCLVAASLTVIIDVVDSVRVRSVGCPRRASCG